MLKVLLKLQMREMLSRLMRRRKKGLASNLSYGGYILLLIALYGFIAFSMYNTFEPFAAGMSRLYLGTSYFGYASVIAFGLALIGSVFSTQSQLFEAKDNEMLLSMPIRPSAILASRMISQYLLSLAYESMILLPAGIAWFVHVRPLTAIGVLHWLIPSLFMPMIALSIGCLLGWLLALLSSHVRNKSYLQMAVSGVMLALYFYIFFRASEEMDVISTGAKLISGQTLKSIWPAYQYGLACNGSWKSTGLVVLVCIAPLAAVWLFLAKSFLYLVNTHHHARAKKYEHKAMHVLSPRRALIRKERRKFFSDASYVINSGMGILMAVLMTVGFLIFHRDIQNVLGDLFSVATRGISDQEALQSALLDLQMIFAAVILTLTASTVCISAPSLSLEGKTIWQIGVLPFRSREVLMAKVDWHLLLTVPVFLVCSIALEFVLPGSLLVRLLLALTPLSMNLFIALLGMVMNVVHPKFDWISSQQCIKRSLPVAVCMLGGMFLVFGGAYVYLQWLVDFLSPGHYLGICTAVLLLLSGLLYLYLCTAGAKKLETYYST